MGKRVEFQCNQRMFIQGCVLTLLGIAGPLLVPPRSMGIYETLSEAMYLEDGGLLILAAMKLVLANVIRMVPHYLGVFLINESVHTHVRGRRFFTFNVVVTFSLILLVYRAIGFFHGIYYDFGIPAILTVGLVLALSYMDMFSVSLFNKVLLVGSLLFSIQWLDVIPAMTAYGSGRGEISMDVKKAAEFIGEELALTEFAVCMCLTLFFAAGIQIQLLYKEHKLKISNENAIRMEKELHHMQLETLKVRNASEVQNLVHDLKSPLTAAQGLVSLAEMMEQNGQIKGYLGRISESLTTMSTMISEILYENVRSRLETEELMRMVLAQVSVVIPSGVLEFTNDCPEAVLMGNRIRLSRAIINLLANAYQAVDHEDGKIVMKTEKADDWIVIRIRDNGSGILPEQMEHIWEMGYSRWNSMGGGLPFVKQVVENHGGTVRITSVPGEGTTAEIWLKGEEMDDGYEADPGDRRQ